MVQDKIEPGNENKMNTESSLKNDHPKSGYGTEEIAAEQEKTEKRRREPVNNTGIGPGEHPNLRPGTDADAATG